MPVDKYDAETFSVQDPHPLDSNASGRFRQGRQGFTVNLTASELPQHRRRLLSENTPRAGKTDADGHHQCPDNRQDGDIRQET